jgi:hypothetical protein
VVVRFALPFRNDPNFVHDLPFAPVILVVRGFMALAFVSL